MDVSVEELMDEVFHQLVWEVLRFWINVDLENLARVKASIHAFEMPDNTKTNSTEYEGWVTQRIRIDPDLTPAMEHVKDSVAYLASQFHSVGNMAGAVRCALLLRHIFKDDVSGGTHDASLNIAINKLVGGDQTYLFGGVDSLNKWLDEEITKGSTKESERTATN